MRVATQAYRIRYGIRMFVKFSPDEGHSCLMIRLSRTRRNDSVLKHEFTLPLSQLYASDVPVLKRIFRGHSVGCIC